MNIQHISSQNNQAYRSQDLDLLVQKTIDLVRDTGMSLGFAESCTGGLLSIQFTKVSGVSDIFKGSVVCYSNTVKENVLGVKSETLKNFGAVSAECAQELSIGALKTLDATAAIAITGIAGPNGGSIQKPVGTVFISVAGIHLAKKLSVIKNYCHQFGEAANNNKKTDSVGPIGREEIQKMACVAALEHLQSLLIVLK
jgi:PncC family amidohydrolase